MNAGGVSSASAVVSTAPSAPASLGATPGDQQILLNWPSSSGATSYTVKRGLSSGSETTHVTGITGTSYTDTNLNNGTTYYYVVVANGPGGASGNSPEASATPSIVVILGLVWTGSASSAWDTTTTNWLNGITPTAYADGDSVLFNNSGTSTSVIINSAVSPGSVTFTNSTINYTISGNSGISGSASLVKTGSGSLTLNNTNYYSGGTIISNSSIIVPNGAANIVNDGAWGTGPITLMGGTAQLNGYGGNNGTYWGVLTNDLVVPSGQTGTLLCPARIAGSGLTGRLTGGGTLNVTVDYVRGLLSGDWSAFTGQINVSPRSGTGDFRIDNPYGYANAAIYLNSGVTLDNINASGQTTDIGELGGASGAFIGAGNGASINPTWRIGAKNTTNTFAGYIGNSGVTSLIKVGTGTLALTGTNSYSGGTIISGGILLVNNLIGSGSGSGSVTVASGGTLGGNGIISGAVTVNYGGALSPGNPLGTLTISNNLTLAGGSTTFMQIEHSPLTNNAVNVSGTLSQAGTLNVTNVGGTAFAAGDSFKLFNAAGYSGSFSSFNLPSLSAGLGWNTGALNTSGVLSVVVNAKPVIGTISISPGGLSLSGSGGVASANFYLLASTNLVTPLTNWTLLTTNQFDTNGNFNFTNTVNTNSPQSFYLLELP
jgi:autotransporter-associated beta strand protein